MAGGPEISVSRPPPVWGLGEGVLRFVGYGAAPTALLVALAVGVHRAGRAARDPVGRHR